MIFKRKNRIENDILELYRKFNDLAGDIKLLEEQFNCLDEECSNCQNPPKFSYNDFASYSQPAYKIIANLQKQIDYLVTITKHEDFQVTSDRGHKNDLIMSGFKLLKEEILDVMEETQGGPSMQQRVVYYLYKEKNV